MWVMNYFFCRPIFLLILSALVASCTSAGQLAQRDNERCVSLGLQPKSDAFSDCVVQMESERQQRMDNNRREMMEKPFIPPTSR